MFQNKFQNATSDCLPRISSQDWAWLGHLDMSESRVYPPNSHVTEKMMMDRWLGLKNVENPQIVRYQTTLSRWIFSQSATQKLVPASPAYMGLSSPSTPSSFLRATWEICWGSTHRDSKPSSPALGIPNCRFHALMPPAMRTMLLQSAPSSTKYLQGRWGAAHRISGDQSWSHKGWCCTRLLSPQLSVSLPRSLCNVSTSRHVATVHVALDASILSENKLQEVQG